MGLGNVTDINERRKKKTIGAYGCGECGGEVWNLWTDHRVTCAQCGAMAENVLVSETLPVGA